LPKNALKLTYDKIEIKNFEPSQNALKLTYSKAEVQKFIRRVNPRPPYKGEGRGVPCHFISNNYTTEFRAYEYQLPTACWELY
jgi:hypothetical protein